MQQNDIIMFIVPKTDILVFWIKVLPFSGGANGVNGTEACPFLGHPCFQNKCFAVFRTWNRWFRPKPAQNCTIIYAHVPFWDILILNLNDLPKSGHATFCAFSSHARTCNSLTCNMLTKLWKISRRQIWQKCYHLLSFCYHLGTHVACGQMVRHHLACDKWWPRNILLDLPNLLSFCYHCYW